jgi:hypothetical protein
MCPFPVDQNARRRLLEAQRAESDALKAVQAASRAHQRAQTKLDGADADLAAAQAGLVAVSGLARAAVLLAEDEAVLRRRVRRSVQSQDGAPTPPRSQRASISESGASDGRPSDGHHD